MLCTLFVRNPEYTSMRRTVPFLLASALLLSGCDSIIDQRGFAPTPGSVEKLEIGTQSRDDVVRLIGSPSSVGTFNPNVWYYISQEQEQYAFFKAKILDQKVMQLSFNDAGRLTTIKNYTLSDGEKITMVSRVTPSAGRELTVLEQLLGNVGRFTPGRNQQSNPGAPTGGGGI
jgi:outer membrane protein assembly factor BamE (lipoprotein component of BamABCDE complex)